MTEITKQSRVSLALAGGVCTTVVIGVMWLQGQLNIVSAALQDMRHEQENMGTRLETALSEQWTVAMQENWALRLKLTNQSLDIPSATHDHEVR